MNVKIGTEAVQFLFGTHKWDFSCSAIVYPLEQYKYSIPSF
jgi:hypothetical protein